MKKLCMYLINVILLHIALQTLKGTEVYINIFQNDFELNKLLIYFYMTLSLIYNLQTMFSSTSIYNVHKWFFTTS